MKVRYIYSACVVIETPDVTICCDPWFTPGAYDGSWYQYPPLERDPLDVIGPVDALYVSHIHPDHYDVRFVRRYVEAFPDVRILIGETEPPYLARKMKIDGFEPEVVDKATFGATTITILPNAAHEVESVDTALVVAHADQSVVNMNDNPIDLAQIDAILAACPGRPTVALLPYSGAGPYPQTYDFPSNAEQQAAAETKTEQFLDTYCRYVDLLDPEVAIPFAGKYVLAGPLQDLNDLRGVPDATEAVARRPHRSVLLEDGGHSVLELDTLTASATRTEPYDPGATRAYLSSLDFPGYDYEREIAPIGRRPLPLLPLLSAAYEKAITRTCVSTTFWFCISIAPGKYFCFDTATHSGVLVRSDVSDLEPRCEIRIDARYLFGLLTRLYHWNNAEIGSHYRSRRVPDVYRREAFAFLHFLQV